MGLKVGPGLARCQLLGVCDSNFVPRAPAAGLLDCALPSG